MRMWKAFLMKQERSKKRLPQRQKRQQTKEKAKIFAKLVLEGKVNAAIQLLDDDTSSGVLQPM